MPKRTAEIEVKCNAGDAISQIESLKERIKELEKDVEGTGKKAKKSAKEFDDAWGDTTKKAGANWKWFGDTIASSVESTVSDISRVINIANGISFVKAVESARSYDATIGRMSAQTGQRVQDLRNRFESFSKAKLIPEEEAAALSKTLGRATYDAIGAQKAIGGLADEAVATGKDASEMIPLGTTLHNVFGIAGDTSDALKSIRGQAEAMGTVGGPAVIQDQLVKLDGVLSSISAKAPGARQQVTALLTAMQGQSQDPNRGAKVFGGLAGFMQSHQVQLARAMHVDPRELTDEEGKIKPEMIGKFQKQFLKDYGKKKYGYEIAVNTFGSEVAKAIFSGHDYAAEAKAAEGATSNAAAEKQAQFAGSDPGKRLAAQQEAARNARKSAEGAMPALDALNNVAAQHPFLAAIGLNVGGQVLSKFAGGAIRGGVMNAFRAATAPGAMTPAETASMGTTGVALGSATLPALALGAVKAHDALIDPLAEGMQRETGNIKSDLASGRKRAVSHWYNFGGASLEDVPPDQQAAAAREYAEKNGAASDAQQNGASGDIAKAVADAITGVFKTVGLTATVNVINQTGGPVQAVAQQKGGGSGKQ